VRHPDERVFRAHIEAGPFQSGVDRGRWRLISIAWPFVVIAVSAAERRGAPQEYALRFECSNYPSVAPTARFWDVEHDCSLPYGRRSWGTGRVALAFRIDWKGDQCLYLPCDRGALPGHDAWRTQHPWMIWDASSDITLYLRVLYDLLHSRDYTGIRGT
jgi:hypothetical protein